MAMVSSYFASVGVQIDPKSLAQVDAYLNSITRKFSKFSTGMGKNSSFQVKLDVDQAYFSNRLRIALNNAGRLQTLRLRNFDISGVSLGRQINSALKQATMTQRGAIRLGTVISASSLAAMRQQIRNSINSLVVSPIINPRVNAATQRGTGGSRARRNGYTGTHHNPMMMGGGIGAMMRYGAFALPAYGGVIGFNNLTNKAAEMQGQQMMLKTATQDPAQAGQQNAYVRDVAKRLGKNPEDILPFYAQMYAGSRGTALESQLPQGFESFLQYGSVMGLGAENLKGSIRAISQMISKRSVTSEELRQQLAEQGMPEAVNIMAKVVTGGDKQALEKLMKKGAVDPVEVLPKFFAELGRLAQIGMADYMKSITKARGDVANSTSDWMKAFLGGGGNDGIAAVYRAWNEVIQASLPKAERIGQIFEGVAHLFAAGMLVPKEWMEFINGVGAKDNIFSEIFGTESSGIMDTIASFQLLKTEFSSLMELLGMDSSFSDLAGQIRSTAKDLAGVVRILRDLFGGISHVINTAGMLSRGDIDGAWRADREYNTLGQANKRIDEVSAAATASGNPAITPETRKALLENELGYSSVNYNTDAENMRSLASRILDPWNVTGMVTGSVPSFSEDAANRAAIAEARGGPRRTTRMVPDNMPTNSPEMAGVAPSTTIINNYNINASNSNTINATTQDNEAIARTVEQGVEGLGAKWASDLQKVIQQAPKGAR